jgi:hypothetical protein
LDGDTKNTSKMATLREFIGKGLINSALHPLLTAFFFLFASLSP